MRVRKNLFKCREATLVEYLDGTLQPGAKRQVERHVLECLNCRKGLEDLSSTLNLADALLPPESNALFSGAFLYKVRQGIDEGKATPPFLNWRSGILGGLGLSALLLWIFTASPVDETHTGVFYPAGQNKAAQLEFVALVDDYWLETASTDQLLSEVSALGESRYVNLLEAY